LKLKLNAIEKTIYNPMDIQEFLGLTAGNWFSQRTNYNLIEQKVDNSKAEIGIEDLDGDAAEVLELCTKQNITRTANSIAFRLSWDNSPDWGKPKQKGSTIMLIVPDPEDSQKGKFVRTSSGFGQSLAIGHYIFGEDLALTLIVEKDNFYAEERQWFAGENLRLRTSLTKNANGITQTTFYSDIRRLASAQPSS
jgi:phycoerythrin-associated linker protein